MYKEKVITNLRIQLESLENLKGFISKKIDELTANIDSLNDESKLGTASVFDFGKDEHKKWIKDIEKTVIREVLKIKKQHKKNLKIQEQGESYTANLLDDNVELN